ncbi:MAG: mycothiol transferase [Mycobacteriaceae bacterium]
MVNLSPEHAGRAGSVVVAGASVRTAKVEHQPPSAWNELPRVIDDRTRPPGTVPHVVAETAQHAGHADITRESPDGSKAMGQASSGGRKSLPPSGFWCS